jgi:hypothetical protein
MNSRTTITHDRRESQEEEEQQNMCKDSSEASTMHAEKQEENVECVLGKQKTKCNLHSQRNGYKCSSNNNNVIVASFIAIFIATTTLQVDASPNKEVQPFIKINKCCEKFEIYVDSRCTSAEEVNASKLKIKPKSEASGMP